MMSLAHIFGTDHIWIFLVPAFGALALLRWAEKKARARAQALEEQEPADVD